MSTWPSREGMPDLQQALEPLRRIVEQWGRRRFVLILSAGAALLWLASGFYIVGPR